MTVTNATGQPGYSLNPSYGAPYVEDTMHVTWKLGTQSSTDLEVGDTLTAVIPAGGYITLELVGDGFVNVDPNQYDGCPSFNYQARLTAVEPVDVSDVKSYWDSGVAGTTDAPTPSQLSYSYFAYEGVWAHWWEVNINRSAKLEFNKDNVHVYDLVSLKALPFWKTTDGVADDLRSVHIDPDAYFGKTLHLIATNRELSYSELRALQGKMSSSEYYTLVMPTEEAFSQYLEDEGYVAGGKLNVSSASSSCGAVTGYFTVDADVANTTASSYALYIDGVKVKSASGAGIVNQYFSKSGYNPSTSHTVKLVINRTVEGLSTSKTYTATQKTASFGKASVTPVKLSSNKVSIGVNVPAREAGKNMTTLKVYNGSKLIKTIKTNGSQKYIFTYSKSGAAKAKYRVKAYWTSKTSVSATSSYAKPRSNSKSFSASTNPAKYAKYNHYFKLTSISQSGSYVTVKGFFLNTHYYSAKIKCKFNLTVNGKVVGKKTITSSKLGQNRIQKVTFKVKVKSTYDLYNNTSGGKWSLYEIH
ncbi:MAG: hypothetical protein PUE49_02215 [Eggerthellales bacterium]|nr:hypothetical protein [Eggerthellales bacterium]